MAASGAGAPHAQGKEQERALLDMAARFDDAYFNGDATALRALLAPDVVLHADHLATEKERHGPEEVSAYFGKYFATYKCKHLPVCAAANPATRSVFALWDDEEVLMRPESFDEALPASGCFTSLSGVWRLELDERLARVTHIWMLRQLTREEKKHRLKHRPSQLYSDFRATALVGPTLDLDERQVAQMRAAAEAFNEAWRTGNPGPVHDRLAPECHTVSPVFGDKRGSREDWEAMLRDVFGFWEVRANAVDIGVTPASNKAFVWWHVQGVQKDTKEENDIWGINLLVFDAKQPMKIVEIVSWRLPLRSEHDHVIKAPSYLEHLGAAGGGGGASGGTSGGGA